MGGTPFGTITTKTLDAQEVLTSLGLTTGLMVSLDAGSIVSAPIAATSWLDLSGNGTDFFLGATAGAEASDPTFNGAAGGLSSSEYWSFDDGDWFHYDTTTPAWVTAIHQNSGVASFMAWVHIPDLVSTHGFTGDFGGGGAVTGFSFYSSTSGTLEFRIGNGDGSLEIQAVGPAPIANEPIFVAFSFDESIGTDGLSIQMNSTETLHTSTVASPSAGAASKTWGLGAITGDGSATMGNGARMYMAVFHNVALTKIQRDAFYDATRGRFGV